MAELQVREKDLVIEKQNQAKRIKELELLVKEQTDNSAKV